MTKKRLLLTCVAVVGCAVLLAVQGCTSNDSDTQADEPVRPPATFKGTGPIKVVCTTGMVADMVTAVGGGRVKVTRLMGEGVDPHVYAPTINDNKNLLQADMIFYSGLHLEPGFLKVFDTLSSGKPVVAVADGLKRNKEPKLRKLEGEFYDPHVWFDPDLWAKCVPVVVRAMSQFDPNNASTYEKSGKTYQQKILELSEYATKQLAAVPNPRVLVTPHDAFSYFGSAFDMKVVAIQGVSTETEAGVGRINELVDLLVKRKVKAVFVESSSSDKNIRALIEGAEAQKHTVRLGGELYSDALGKDGTPAGEYLGMVRHNIDTIAKALSSDD